MPANDGTVSGEDARAALAVAIRAELGEWRAKGLATDGAGINAGAARGGCCSDFARKVLQRLGRETADAMGVDELRPDNLQVVDPDDAIGRPFDRELMARHWPAVVPPSGLDWDGLDLLSEEAGFSGMTHTWLTMAGLHFDAEAPDGVENLFDLPFFRRVVESWFAERRPAHAMGR